MDLLNNILCPTEDSANCLWLANVQGNQQGVSFLDLGGVAYYADSIPPLILGIVAVALTIFSITGLINLHRKGA